jgi:hypothetical protein
VSVRTPSYRLYKPTGLAVVTLGGRDLYLGRFGTPESKAEYDRVIAEWLANGRRPGVVAAGGRAGPDLTVSELILGYVRFAETYYVKGGAPT